jgi:DNA polymerase
VDERRRRAWAALGIGPAWRLRDPAARATGDPAVPPADDEVVRSADDDATGTAPRPAHGAAPRTDDATRSTGTAAALADPGTVTPDPVALARSPAPPSERDPVVARLAWPELAEAVAGCMACGLCRTRRNTVFGVGPRPARWMLVGEAPGEQEDERGEPFVGPAGRLLDQMLASIGVDRPAEAFIANVLKCRPPGNRNPQAEEVARCEPYLLRQVELLRPTLIVALGRFAAQSLLRTDASIASLRGRVHRLRAGTLEVPLVVTYHPAYLLRTLPDKSKSWADLRLARRTFDAAGR